tara:strand:- start:2239 stop:3324 length:1086 start_codon:yes stop_codon:yes gene_type:complete
MIEMSQRKLRVLGTLTCAIGVMLAGAGRAADQDKAAGTDKSELKALGLQYQLRELKEPRPNRVHVLRVDFSTGKIKPAVVVGKDPDGDGPAETTLTNPLELASGPSVLAFINTNPWDSFPDKNGRKNRSWYAGQPVDISGIAAFGGRVRSPAQANATSVWVDRRGRVRMGRVPGAGGKKEDVPESDRIVEAMAGFQQIVKAGSVVPAPGGAVHPRTAIGVDRSGMVMWLVVVDGRQSRFSEGMNVHELGRQMLELGCWNAMNMDGGGSSVMGLVSGKDGLRVINSPSDRRPFRRIRSAAESAARQVLRKQLRELVASGKRTRQDARKLYIEAFPPGRGGNQIRIRPLPMVLTIRKTKAPGG